MSLPGRPTAPPFADRPDAPPQVPPADPWLREIFRRQVLRMIGGSASAALAIFGIVLFWLPLIGLVLSLGVVITHRYQVRLREYYAAYFAPHEFPEQGALDVGHVVGLVGLGLSGLANVAWLTLLVTNAALLVA